MTHHDAGKYALKHPSGTVADDRIADAVRARMKEGKLACAAASKISNELGVSMAEIGRTADLLEIRIHKCLLGLFGRSTETGEKKPLKVPEFVSDELKKAVLEGVEDGKMTCQVAWKIADEQNVSRETVAGVCELHKIKIVSCQLGAF